MARIWDIEEIEKLIELVSVRPCIWDSNDTDYTDPKARHAAFEAIAQNMQIERADIVKAKFKNLRAQFFRILRNPAQLNSPKRWMHFDALRFLQKDDLTDKTSTKPAKNENIEFIKDVDMNEEYIVEPEEIIENTAMPFSDQQDFIAENLYDELIDTNTIKEQKPLKSASPKLVKNSEKLNTHHFKRKPTLVMKTTTKRKDEHTILGELIANELRLLKNQKHLQQTLKCEILKAIYEANKTLLT